MYKCLVINLIFLPMCKASVKSIHKINYPIEMPTINSVYKHSKCSLIYELENLINL